MVVQFRKSKNVGPFRFTLSKRGIGATAGGFPIFKLIGFLILAGMLCSACSTSSYKSSTPASSAPQAPAPAPATSVAPPTAGAPKDGRWPEPKPSDAVPYGTTSPHRTTGVFTEYTFSISAPPTISAANGTDVKITSNVVVNRVGDKGFNEAVDRTNSFAFMPGESAPEYQMDESHGTAVAVDCQNDQPAVNETTVCTVAFVAPASEITNSYWQINGLAMGTWPSQGA